MLIQNRIRQIIFAVALAATLLVLFMGSLIPTARAASIVVNSTADTTINDTVCTLREAIINANDDAPTWANCAAGSGADTIIFNQALGNITLTSSLPQITGDLAINGLKGLIGKQTISGADAYRVFEVASGATLNLRNVRVTNGATPTDGGGLYICNACVAVVNMSVFSNNSASNNGGAIYNYGGALTISNSDFTGNSAIQRGGALYMPSSGSMVVTGSNFISNTSGSGGGALNSEGGLMAANNSVFRHNSAGSGPGGAINSGGILTTTNSSFTDNTTTSDGGAVAAGGVATVTGGDFISNTASYGGALTVNSCVAAVTSSNFISNTATNYGGAIATYKGGAITPSLAVTGSLFSGNHANDLGGGIYNYQGIVMVTTGVFTANTAGGYGGAINNWVGNFIVAGSTFANNSANDSGGAIYVGDVFTVTNSTFTNNSAVTHGGAIHHGSASLLVDHSTFSGNGGPDALYKWWNAEFTMRHSLVANSTNANCSDPVTDGGYNLQYGGTAANSCGAAIETANPQLEALADNGGETPTMALPEGSAALNRIPGAGGCGVGVTVDQRGVSRPQGGLCEIGAYEKEEQNKVFLPVVLKQS